MIKDKYDIAVKFLQSIEDEYYKPYIELAWCESTDGFLSSKIKNLRNIEDKEKLLQAHCLFKYVNPSGNSECDSYYNCGCLTQIKGCTWFDNTYYVAIAKDGKSKDLWLTQIIKLDPNIPPIPHSIKKEDLPYFAEIQRELDIYYGRI